MLLVRALIVTTLAVGCSRAPFSPGPYASPLPVDPAGVDPERVLFTSSVCAAATMTLPDGKLDVGCPSHPPFDRPEQKPDGKLSRFTGDPLRFCSIDAIHRGSFTRAGAKQAVLSFAQCKANPPHDDVWDAAYPGSALLVEDIGGRWTPTAYEPGVNARFCLVDRRADGRDVLLCRSGLEAGAAGGVTYFFLLDFARAARRSGTFAKVFDDLRDTVKVTDFRLADLNADGTGDLVVDVERARAAPSAGLAVLPPPTKTELAFVSRGDGFVPTDATRRVLEGWLTEVGDQGGVGEAAPPALGEGTPR